MRRRELSFVLGVFITPISFSFTVAPGFKAEGLQRKLYGHDVILWTESSLSSSVNVEDVL